MNNTTEIVKKNLKSRYKKERNFARMGVFGITISCLFLVMLFSYIVFKGMPAFWVSKVSFDVDFSPQVLEIAQGETNLEKLKQAKYKSLISTTLYKQFPDVEGRVDKRRLKGLVSTNAQYQLQNLVIEDPSLIGKTKSIEFLLDDDVDTFIKKGGVEIGKPINGRLNQKQINWIVQLSKENKINTHFNTSFFTNSSSSQAESAGVYGAVIGTIFTILVTIAIAFPVGVFAAIYLEEFAPKNRLTDLVEININNLAAVPSIVFGLFGLAVFIGFFGIPRSSALVGGLVLALMTLPTIIISSRAAIKAVPPSLKEAALGLGASKMQTVFHQTVPIALPGMLTGGIIGIAQALGETAPLMMIGMMSFLQNVPSGLTSDATVLPVQIYMWSKKPEIAFVEKASAAILVLLIFLLLFNASAIYLRKKFEKN